MIIARSVHPLPGEAERKERLLALVDAFSGRCEGVKVGGGECFGEARVPLPLLGRHQRAKDFLRRRRDCRFVEVENPGDGWRDWLCFQSCCETLVPPR